MMEALALAVYSTLLIMIAHDVGNRRGYERGLDHAAHLIFGLPVVWP